MVSFAEAITCHCFPLLLLNTWPGLKGSNRGWESPLLDLSEILLS